MIISVSGGSGAGKSLFSRKLAEILPNSLLINGDTFMHIISQKKEQVILTNIGKEKNDYVFSYNYYLETFENTKKWIETIEPEMFACIQNEICTKGRGKDFIIIDWCFSPFCKWYTESDETICICADYASRYERLSKRLQDKTNYNEGDKPFLSYTHESFIHRLQYTALNDYGYTSKHYINNDCNIDEYYQRIYLLKDYLEDKLALKQISEKTIKPVTFVER